MFKNFHIEIDYSKREIHLILYLRNESFFSIVRVFGFG